MHFGPNGVPEHTQAYRLRRFLNWFPLGLGYASLMFMRYNLKPGKGALSDDGLMTMNEFGWIFGVGSIMYFVGFLVNGPLVDRHGGRWGMLTGVTGAMVANALMGLSVYGVMVWGWQLPLFWVLMLLYGGNMFFQSLGAMSIVTTKMPWFHVRERGTFSTIFGVMISLGVYFAFDWGYAIRSATRAVVDVEKLSVTASLFQKLLGSGNTGTNQNWWLFLFPVLFAGIWLIWMAITLRNKPSEAGFLDFETGDQQVSGETLSMREMLREVFTNPKHRVLRIIVAIEFCSGAIRNSTFNFYPEFADAIGFRGDFFVTANWGLCLMLCGITGGILTGWISDKFFQSRRGPPVAYLYGVMSIALLLMLVSLTSNTAEAGSVAMGIGLLLIALSVIGVHGILSGTAAGDFAGTNNTGKAVGIVDGAVYIGTGLQSILTGMALGSDEVALSQPAAWYPWLLIILPLALLGTFLSARIYHALPKGKTSH